MANDDTVKLLRECSSGVAMGIDAIKEIWEDVINDNLKSILHNSMEKHHELEKDVNNYLRSLHDEPKEPAAMAKGMSHLKTNFKMTTNPSDATIADLITDGCNMGIKSLYRYLNQYKTADNDIRRLAKDIIDEESNLREAVVAYL